MLNVSFSRRRMESNSSLRSLAFCSPALFPSRVLVIRPDDFFRGGERSSSSPGSFFTSLRGGERSLSAFSRLIRGGDRSESTSCLTLGGERSESDPPRARGRGERSRRRLDRGELLRPFCRGGDWSVSWRFRLGGELSGEESCRRLLLGGDWSALSPPSSSELESCLRRRRGGDSPSVESWRRRRDRRGSSSSLSGSLLIWDDKKNEVLKIDMAKVPKKAFQNYITNTEQQVFRVHYSR